MAAALESAQQKSAWVACVAVITVGVLVLVGLTFDWGYDPALILAGAALIAVIMKVASWRTGAALRADSEGGVYFTVSGPISFHVVDWGPEYDGGPTYFFRVESEDFPVSARIWDEIRFTTWGVVDYAPCSRMVFALRDRSGRVVYAG
jgi:hypothetical protein